jgi:hypothetical protein
MDLLEAYRQVAGRCREVEAEGQARKGARAEKATTETVVGEQLAPNDRLNYTS